MTLTANLAPVEWPTPATDETLDSNLEKWRQKNRESEPSKFQKPSLSERG